MTRAAIFLVVTIDPDGAAAVRDLLSDLGNLVKAVGFRVPDGELSCVAAIGSDAWSRLFDGPRPAGLHPFPELVGAVHRAPSTPGDLLFHVRAQRMDLCFGLASLIMDRLRAAVTVHDEVHGFKFFDARDLLGFVDGTANPLGQRAAAAVLIGDEEPCFAGGTYVIVQKYLHRQEAWDGLSIEDQERTIGRTKLEDVELNNLVKPADSHVARTTIVEPDGDEREILRDNMPFGRVGARECGTYFIGYARTPEVTERMLARMFLGDDLASHDRLLDFVTPVTGTLFFVPSADLLEEPPGAPETTTEGTDAHSAPASTREPASTDAASIEGGPAFGGREGASGTDTPPSDGSLGIGDLKGTSR